MDRAVGSRGRRAARPRGGRGKRNRPKLDFAGLDRTIHEPVRLGIMSALGAGGCLSFAELKRVLSATDGNLSVHARKLELAGFISCRKSFQGRTPLTEYQLTTAGRDALGQYLHTLENLIEASRSLQDAEEGAEP